MATFLNPSLLFDFLPNKQVDFFLEDLPLKVLGKKFSNSKLLLVNFTSVAVKSGPAQPVRSEAPFSLQRGEICGSFGLVKLCLERCDFFKGLHGPLELQYWQIGNFLHQILPLLNISPPSCCSIFPFGFWLLAFGFALGIKFKFYWLKFFTNLPSGLFVGLPCCASSAKKFWAICSS